MQMTIGIYPHEMLFFTFPKYIQANRSVESYFVIANDIFFYSHRIYQNRIVKVYGSPVPHPGLGCHEVQHQYQHQHPYILGLQP